MVRSELSSASTETRSWKTFLTMRLLAERAAVYDVVSGKPKGDFCPVNTLGDVQIIKTVGRKYTISLSQYSRKPLQKSLGGKVAVLCAHSHLKLFWRGSPYSLLTWHVFEYLISINNNSTCFLPFGRGNRTGLAHTSSPFSVTFCCCNYYYQETYIQGDVHWNQYMFPIFQQFCVQLHMYSYI